MAAADQVQVQKALTKSTCALIWLQLIKSTTKSCPGCRADIERSEVGGNAPELRQVHFNTCPLAEDHDSGAKCNRFLS
eukprot:1156221-Pelagomonas_calceolata.AAC.17